MQARDDRPVRRSRQKEPRAAEIYQRHLLEPPWFQSPLRLLAPPRLPRWFQLELAPRLPAAVCGAAAGLAAALGAGLLDLQRHKRANGTRRAGLGRAINGLLRAVVLSLREAQHLLAQRACRLVNLHASGAGEATERRKRAAGSTWKPAIAADFSPQERRHTSS